MVARSRFRFPQRAVLLGWVLDPGLSELRCIGLPGPCVCQSTALAVGFSLVLALRRAARVVDTLEREVFIRVSLGLGWCGTRRCSLRMAVVFSEKVQAWPKVRRIVWLPEAV